MRRGPIRMRGGGGLATGGPATGGLATGVLAAAVLAVSGACAAHDGSTALPPVGLEAIDRLRFPPLRFEPPVPTRFELSNGVPVFHLRDESLPIVEIFVDLKGGYIYFDREDYAAGSALLSLMRNGGTATLTPDSLDALMEFHALGMSTSSDGGRMALSVSALTRQLDVALDIWTGILLRPRFDEAAVERWRLRELEAVRRIGDFPGSLAVMRFNAIMYGDHPTGWIMREADLAPERLTPDRLRRLHAAAVCPEGAVIGVAGDIDEATLRAALESALGGWAPCGSRPERPPPPDVKDDPAVYVIHHDLGQSTIVAGQPGGVLLRESPDYFASRIANWVIGGSGLTSRLMARLRTEEGLAYSASSIWGAAREHERIFGAITHTGSETTVAATRLLLETLADAVTRPPDSAEVRLARQAITNGFVFGFNSPGQIVARQVAYLADGFPHDWLDRYLRGITAVDERSVRAALRRHVDPAGFTVLIVGDTTSFPLAELGPVRVLSHP